MQELLAEQEASGLSVARFARGRGVSAWTLYEWRRRLRREREPQASEGFVQVHVARTQGRTATIAVELPTDVRVHVPPGFEEDELRRLLVVLGTC